MAPPNLNQQNSAVVYANPQHESDMHTRTSSNNHNPNIVNTYNNNIVLSDQPIQRTIPTNRQNNSDHNMLFDSSQIGSSRHTPISQDTRAQIRNNLAQQNNESNARQIDRLNPQRKGMSKFTQWGLSKNAHKNKINFMLLFMLFWELSFSIVFYLLFADLIANPNNMIY